MALNSLLIMSPGAGRSFPSFQRRFAPPFPVGHSIVSAGPWQTDARRAARQREIAKEENTPGAQCILLLRTNTPSLPSVTNGMAIFQPQPEKLLAQ